MRDVTTTRDVLRHVRARGMHDLLGIEASTKVTLGAAELARCFEKEKRRVQAQEQAVAAMRAKLLAIRRKLKYAKERNLAICALRERLERERWKSRPDPPVAEGENPVGCMVIEY